jgi:hypothetical protein
MKTYRQRRDTATTKALAAVALLAGAFLALPTNTAQAQHERYLRSIRADLESLGIELAPEEGATGAGPIEAGQPPAAGSEAKSDLADAQAEFEAKLKERAPGTYILYQRLTPTQKTKVFADYRETGDLRRVRSKIMELVLGR